MQRSATYVVTLSVVGASVLWIAGMSFAAEQEGAAEPAQAEKPAAIEAYDRLLAAHKAAQAGQPVDINLEPFPEDALDIIAGYERLLAHVDKVLNRPEMRRIDDIVSREPYGWTPGDRSEAAKFLAANQELIEEIRQMANRGGSVHPLDFSKGLEMELPHLAQMRSCARLLRADAAVNGAKGDYAAAVDDVIAGMKIGDALVREPVLISQLVRIAIYLVANSAIQNSFSGTDLSPDLTERLMTHLAQADHRGEFSESLAGELYMGRMMFVALRSGDRNRIPEGMVLGPVDDADERTYIEMMTRLIAAARLPYYKALPELKRMEDQLAELGPYSAQFVPALARSCQAQARHEAVLEVAQLGIMLEQYKGREGSYPLTLDPIAGQFGGTLPVDPFTGRAYIYRPSFDSFLLYSMGENLVDDGGRHDYRKGDIVWRGKRKR